MSLNAYNIYLLCREERHLTRTVIPDYLQKCEEKKKQSLELQPVRSKLLGYVIRERTVDTPYIFTYICTQPVYGE